MNTKGHSEQLYMYKRLAKVLEHKLKVSSRKAYGEKFKAMIEFAV